MTSKREEVIEVISEVKIDIENGEGYLLKHLLVPFQLRRIADALLDAFDIVPFCTCKHISGGTTSMIDSEPRNICVACDRPIGRAREEVK